MRGDWKDEARRFEDIDRAAQKEAERRLLCRCERCIAPFECSACAAIRGLCADCEAHFSALADAYESESGR